MAGNWHITKAGFLISAQVVVLGEGCIFFTMKPRGTYWLWLALVLSSPFSIFMVARYISANLTGSSDRPTWRRNISILLWHWPFNRSYPLKGNVCLNTYSIPQCLLTDNRSHYDQADVVVFHHHELMCAQQKLPLHLRRPQGQMWVWLSLEPPEVNRNLSAYNHLFNRTMTYRRDADIFMPYGQLIPQRTNETFHPPEKRSCLVSWVISNFKPGHKRSKVYRQLREHIPISVYGSSNWKPLTRYQLLPTIARCHFYLAFENSIFKDYITEKLWRNAFLAGTVPVVLGPPRSNYEAFLPPDSFIHVDDFKSVRELAVYLKMLAGNRTQYEMYFRWHKDYAVHIITDWRERLCHICKEYSQLTSPKVYHDLQGWAWQ